MDFVILWVNNNDPYWKSEYMKYSLLESGEKKEVRYRDWNNLHYWFRGVDKFAPWVNKIFLITANQIPSWLKIDHPKLRLVDHKEYIPNELLPTFSSNTIEMFLHQIPDLSEQFVLFNDDFFLINKITPERFFKKGKPVDICAMNVYNGSGLSSNCMCNIEIINKYFDKKEVIKKNFLSWFSFHNGKNILKTWLLIWWPYFVGFYEHHLPQPFLKSILKEVWEKEGESIYNSVRPRFRTKTNFTQYLFRYWQLVSGNFTCYNICSDSITFQELKNKDIDNVVEIIRQQKKNIIVINDSDNIDFNYAKDRINKAFEVILPKKSSFEK